MQIEVFTQSAIKLTKQKVIYFDPYKIDKDYHDADYIFITHDHYDHYDEDSLKKIIKEDTKLIIPKCLEEKIINITYNYFVVDENKEYNWKDFSFKTIPAYNIDKGFHPKEAGYVGYLIEIDQTKYYIMGDTDVTEEAKEVKERRKLNIKLVAVSSLDEAIEYLNNI